MELHNDIIFVRHAENVCDESIDNALLPLSETGVQQAQHVAKLLDNAFDVVYCSTSFRTLATAKIISGSLTPQQDARLLERGWGNSSSDGNETDDEARTRISEFLSSIDNLYDNKRILIVTHGALIKLAQDVIENNISPRSRVNNCMVVEYSCGTKTIYNNSQNVQEIVNS